MPEFYVIFAGKYIFTRTYVYEKLYKMPDF